MNAESNALAAEIAALKRPVSQLRYGTEEEHRATLERAHKAGVSYVWSGDIVRNPYLGESLQFGVESGIIETRFVEYEQESGWKIEWPNSDSATQR